MFGDAEIQDLKSGVMLESVAYKWKLCVEFGSAEHGT
jgi:hypothetical protein